jgi:hypothetical protein
MWSRFIYFIVDNNAMLSCSPNASFMINLLGIYSAVTQLTDDEHAESTEIHLVGSVVDVESTSCDLMEIMPRSCKLCVRFVDKVGLNSMSIYLPKPRPSFGCLKTARARGVVLGKSCKQQHQHP